MGDGEQVLRVLPHLRGFEVQLGGNDILPSGSYHNARGPSQKRPLSRVSLNTMLSSRNSASRPANVTNHQMCDIVEQYKT